MTLEEDQRRWQEELDHQRKYEEDDRQRQQEKEDRQRRREDEERSSYTSHYIDDDYSDENEGFDSSRSKHQFRQRENFLDSDKIMGLILLLIILSALSDTVRELIVKAFTFLFGAFTSLL